MAVIKCKMCGGDLQIVEGNSVCECEYCGSKQTVPTADNEKKMTLFTRANRLLRNCEFDKASGVFESIVAEFPEEAEAYWGLVLCKYGIEYVDDPATGKKIPTCHRSSFDSVLDDSNFEQACENNDAVARRVYRDEARAIEELRKNIIEVSGKEEPYDIFISYKETDENGDRTLDSVIAQDIYKELTDEGYRVFFSRISLEDKLGTEYEPYIFAALNSAKVMIVVGTDYENFDSVWVKNEWSRFLKLISSEKNKTLIPVFKNMDAYDMPKEFAKLSAQDMGKVGAMQDLVRGVVKLIGKKKDQGDVAHKVSADSGMSALNAQTSAMMKRGFMMLNDMEWSKADDFFERVLNNDAECGQAYWGKVLAAAKAQNAEQYGSGYLFNRLKELSSVKTYTLNVRPIFSLAREADDTGLLQNFSDQELGKLLKDFEVALVKVQSAAQYYETELKLMTDLSYLTKLANSPDFARASQYADEAVRQEQQKALQCLKEVVSRSVVQERENKKQAENEIKRREKQAVSAIRSRLSSVSEEFEQHHKRIEAAQQKAEMDAEAAYKEAQNKYEKDYQTAVANQIAAYEVTLENWRQRKAEYEKNYGKATAECQSIEEKIGQFITDRDKLTGLFTGRRRKELDENISLLKKKLEEIRIPEDPGPMPEKPSAPQRGMPPRREIFTAKTGGRSIDPRDYIKRAFSPEYMTLMENLEKLKAKQTGDVLQFGTYHIKDGKTAPIEWLVLDKDNNCLLVISKYALDCHKYNSDKIDVTWETCTLRKWLNETFLQNAFSAEEQALIPTVTVSADKNPDHNTEPGNSTQERIFPLSISEASKYLVSDTARECKPTEYARANGSYRNSDNGNCWWWLRTPGLDSMHVAEVNTRGAIDTGGYGVSNDRGAVRPALWINLEF